LLPLGDIAARSPYTNRNALCSLGARFDENGLRLAWTREPVEPAVFELDPQFPITRLPNGFQSTSFRRFIDLRPAWNWSVSARDIQGFLHKCFDWSEYATIAGVNCQISFPATAQEREVAWQAALGVLGKGSLYPFPVEIAQLENHPYQSTTIMARGAHFLNSAPLERVLQEAQKNAATTLVPPWPLPDRDRSGCMIWEGFSDAAVLDSIRVVYLGALEYYQCIVKALFQRYARRMPLRAAMPFDLHISVLSMPDTNRPALGEWAIIPKASGASSVTVKRGHQSTYAEEQAAYDAAVRVRPELRTHARYLNGEGELKWFQSFPITELTYEWLREDIKQLFSA
jgi:hypothetical protein